MMLVSGSHVLQSVNGAVSKACTQLPVAAFCRKIIHTPAVECRGECVEEHRAGVHSYQGRAPPGRAWRL